MTNPAHTPRVAAEYCGCSIRHFERWIAPALPMVDVRAPGAAKAKPRYRKLDIDAWLAARVIGPDK